MEKGKPIVGFEQFGGWVDAEGGGIRAYLLGIHGHPAFRSFEIDCRTSLVQHITYNVDKSIKSIETQNTIYQKLEKADG